MESAPQIERAAYIDENGIDRILSKARCDKNRVAEILVKARELKGLTTDEAATLLVCDDPEILAEVFEAARWVKDRIYGNRLVLFAPLYISNRCVNVCRYCAFRADNKTLHRRSLTVDEIREETRRLIATGQKRVLLVAGESPQQRYIDTICAAIDAIYETREGRGEIRRINVNAAPMNVAEFRQLKGRGIGTYQLFQETYHRGTYRAMHIKGPKTDYDWRISAMERAFAGGIDDLGIGVLFGLYDYRFEVLALLQHIRRLEQRIGVGPHTISVPRLEPASGSDVGTTPPASVSDADFEKVVAVLRLCVPYTGIIMSTRESPAMRSRTFALGVSQISAGSRTSPGGYGKSDEDDAQFQLGDHRSLDEVVADVLRLGYVPSFCTACYRKGRTGADFMDLAKPGLIKQFCLPNALLTCKEYLEDFASPKTRELGDDTIVQSIQDIPSVNRRGETTARLEAIEKGERDNQF